MDLNLILGPIILAVSINCILYGTCIVQWYTYWTAGFRDRWTTKWLVSWVMILDSLQTMSTMYMLWECTVPNFGNPDIFLNLPWPFSTTPITIALISSPIQLFLGYRIKVLSHVWFWFCLVAVLSLTQGAVGIAGGVLATRLSNPDELSRLRSVADVWIIFAVVTDVLITALLLFFLHRSKTGFQRTDSILQDLIRLAVETASIGATCCVVDLIVFNVKGNTNLHYIFALLQGRIYTNTLMMTLNSRTGFREKLNNGEAQAWQNYNPEVIFIPDASQRPRNNNISLQKSDSLTFARHIPIDLTISVSEDVRTDATSSYLNSPSNESPESVDNKDVVHLA